MVLGLATRRVPSAFPALVARDGGDALWAAAVFWLVTLVRPELATARVALVALALAYAVEFSQLWHAPWLHAVRATRVGALVLGRGFLWSDLVRYAAGVALAAALDAWVVQRGARRPPTPD